MKALVIGYGSIGARHARLLRQLGCEVAVASRRVDVPFARHETLAQALAATRFGYVVIANETAKHHDTLCELARAGFDGTLLVEKPLFSAPVRLPANRFQAAFVGYNLRFHPLLSALRDALAGETALCVQAYAGQYLPTWRPGTDYAHSYSSRRASGGGVLRDLSHELDHLLWLFGEWRNAAALGGHFSSLAIDSDDVFSVLLVLARCPAVTLTLNYLDRIHQRAIVVNTDRHTFRVDLVSGRLQRDDKVRSFSVALDDTYIAQHRAVLEGRHELLCTLDRGDEVVRLIAAIETSASGRTWQQRAIPVSTKSKGYA